MKAESRHSLAKTAAHEWRQFYYAAGTWMNSNKTDGKETYEKLLELGKNPDPDEVEAITRSIRFTTLRCKVCKECTGESWVLTRCGHICDCCITQMSEVLLDEGIEFEDENIH